CQKYVFTRRKRFSEGREDVGDYECPERRCISRTEENLEKYNCRLGFRMITKFVNIDEDIAWKIFREDLSMTKVCAKMSPRILAPAEKTSQ
ncbi:hypothetical protein J437_LFUL007927, partial [Ladona fulva]